MKPDFVPEGFDVGRIHLQNLILVILIEDSISLGIDKACDNESGWRQLDRPLIPNPQPFLELVFLTVERGRLLSGHRLKADLGP
jgi:hypothetical protein